MNTTPRWLNRTTLTILGLIVMALGAAAILIAAIPAIRDGWSQTAPEVFRAVTELWIATPIAGFGHSWMWVAVLAVLVLLIVLAVLAVTRQGRGRTGQLLRKPAAEGAVQGAVVITTAVAENAITGAITSNPDVLSAHVTGHRLRRQTAIKVTVAARKGASPARIVSAVQDTIARWDEAFGMEVPVVIEIVSGIRTRTSRTPRVK